MTYDFWAEADHNYSIFHRIFHRRRILGFWGTGLVDKLLFIRKRKLKIPDLNDFRIAPEIRLIFIKANSIPTFLYMATTRERGDFGPMVDSLETGLNEILAYLLALGEKVPESLGPLPEPMPLAQIEANWRWCREEWDKL